jgi:predicted nucleic acid-binding protein
MTKRLVAFDSCSVLHLLMETPVWYPHLRPLYDGAFAGRTGIVISEVSVAECLRLDCQGGKALAPHESAAIISQFFHQPFLVRRGVTSRESLFAGKLIRMHDIGTCDALIAATAIFAGAEILYTTDGCTKRRKAGKLLTVGTIHTDCGKRMEVQPPDMATCQALSQAAPKGTP